jgi:uncharacterized membrane protein HdeD (DUF308 family)
MTIAALAVSHSGGPIMVTMLADRWWIMAVRGVAAIVFGVLTFIWPGASLFALVLLFGAYSVVDGAFNIGAGISMRGEPRWGWLVFGGAISIAVGVLTFLWPGITAFALLMLIAAWALVTGVAEIAAAIRLRKHVRGEWLLALSGILSIAFGVLMFLFPGTGALAVVLWIGAYAVVFGVLLLALAFRLRSWRNQTRRQVPTGGVPAHA